MKKQADILKRNVLIKNRKPSKKIQNTVS